MQMKTGMEFHRELICEDSREQQKHSKQGRLQNSSVQGTVLLNVRCKNSSVDNSCISLMTVSKKMACQTFSRNSVFVVDICSGC